MNKNDNNKMKPLAACQLAISSPTPPACAQNLIYPADKFRPSQVEGLMREAGFKPKCTLELFFHTRCHETYCNWFLPVSRLPA
jgi:hypothetical protein